MGCPHSFPKAAAKARRCCPPGPARSCLLNGNSATILAGFPTHVGTFPTPATGFPTAIDDAVLTIGPAPAKAGHPPVSIVTIPTTIGCRILTIGDVPVAVRTCPTRIGSLPASIGVRVLSLGDAPADAGNLPARLATRPARDFRPFSAPSCRLTADAASVSPSVMNIKQQSHLKMLIAVLGVLDKFKTVWQAITAFATARNDLSAAIDAVNAEALFGALCGALCP